MGCASSSPSEIHPHNASSPTTTTHDINTSLTGRRRSSPSQSVVGIPMRINVLPPTPARSEPSSPVATKNGTPQIMSEMILEEEPTESIILFGPITTTPSTTALTDTNTHNQQQTSTNFDSTTTTSTATLLNQLHTLTQHNMQLRGQLAASEMRQEEVVKDAQRRKEKQERVVEEMKRDIEKLTKQFVQSQQQLQQQQRTHTSHHTSPTQSASNSARNTPLLTASHPSHTNTLAILEESHREMTQRLSEVQSTYSNLLTKHVAMKSEHAMMKTQYDCLKTNFGACEQRIAQLMNENTVSLGFSHELRLEIQQSEAKHEKQLKEMKLSSQHLETQCLNKSQEVEQERREKVEMMKVNEKLRKEVDAVRVQLQQTQLEVEVQKQQYQQLQLHQQSVHHTTTTTSSSTPHDLTQTLAHFPVHVVNHSASSTVVTLPPLLIRSTSKPTIHTASPTVAAHPATVLPPPPSALSPRSAAFPTAESEAEFQVWLKQQQAQEQHHTVASDSHISDTTMEYKQYQQYQQSKRTWNHPTSDESKQELLNTIATASKSNTNSASALNRRQERPILC